MDRIMLTSMLPCSRDAEQSIQLKGWPRSTRQAGLVADFIKVIRNLHFKLHEYCNCITIAGLKK
jgi:hypothetical protein